MGYSNPLLIRGLALANAPGGSLLYEDPPHSVDIYLPAAPTVDAGGGIKQSWTLAQSDVPCSINQGGGSNAMRQKRMGNTITGQVAFLSEKLTVTIVAGTKFITKDEDPGQTLLFEGFSAPNRAYGHYAQDLPAFTYCRYSQQL